MTEQVSAVGGRGVLPQLLSLLRPLWHARARNRLAALAAMLVVVVCANAAGQIRLNAWSGDFYDTLAARSLPALWTQLGIFLGIVGVMLLLVVGQTWLQETIKVRLREWLTHDLLDQWLAPRRPHDLAHAGEIGANPDQRMQEDARHLVELSTSLAFGLLMSSLLLVSFVGVLWRLSGGVVFEIDGRSFAIPGYMVWCALIYAAAGSFLSWLVGRPLIRLNAERYAREAELRFALVRVHENADAVALSGGEGSERRILDRNVVRVVDLGRLLVGGLTRLTWVTSGYGWLAIVVPVLVAAPGYFGGSLSLGGLMMVAGAFTQVQQALRWFVDNFAGIADWRATLMRVVVFRDSLERLEDAGDGAGGGRIAAIPHPAGLLAFEGVAIRLPDGLTALETPLVEIDPGERVLIAGPPGLGKDKLLRAAAGIWSRGQGRILLPPREGMMYVTARPYLPLTTLREAILYPAAGKAALAAADDRAVKAALEEVGLAYLIRRLGDRERWDKTLSMDAQQRLILARIILSRPDWLLLEDAACMSEDHHRLLRDQFAGALARTAVIAVGTSPALDGFYTRTLNLTRLPPETGGTWRAEPQPVASPALGGPALAIV